MTNNNYWVWCRLSKTALSCMTVELYKTELWRRKTIYGTLGHSTVNTWTSPFPGLWLVAGLRVDILVYKYQLQFSSSTVSALSFWLTVLGHTSAGHVHWYTNQVCLDSGGSWSRLSDTGAREAQHSHLTTETGFPWATGSHSPRL